MAKRIGEYLIDLGVLNEKQVAEILAYAKTSGIRFGEAAVRLGLLKSEFPVRSFRHQYAVDFFHVNAAYFPQSTRNFIPLDIMLTYGLLPLGLKTKSGLFKRTKIFNVGLLDPTRKDVERIIEASARQNLGNEFGGFKTYLVLADEFLEVLRKVYGLSQEDLMHRNVTSMDRALHAYLTATLPMMDAHT